MDSAHYKESVSEIIREVEKPFKDQPCLQDRLSRPITTFANWDKSEGTPDHLVAVEILSGILEILIRYSESANFIYPIKYSMDFSFKDLIKEKVESIKDIFNNLCQYIPGLEDLDSKELSHITKIIKMYPDLTETLHLIQQRSLLISCLYKSQLEDEVAGLFRDFSSKITQISLKKNINERVIKLNLLDPYKRIIKALNL